MSLLEEYTKLDKQIMDRFCKDVKFDPIYFGSLIEARQCLFEDLKYVFKTTSDQEKAKADIRALFQQSTWVKEFERQISTSFDAALAIVNCEKEINKAFNGLEVTV